MSITIDRTPTPKCDWCGKVLMPGVTHICVAWMQPAAEIARLTAENDRLTREVAKWTTVAASSAHDADRLTAEVERLQEALDQIALKAHHGFTAYELGRYTPMQTVERLARAALKDSAPQPPTAGDHRG